MAIGSDSSSPVQSNPQQLNPYSQSAALQQFQIVSNYGYPTLIRQVVLTYQGRRLREEIVDGTIRYVDDAGVFIGGLVREQETDLSLLKRFEQYGKIVSAEVVELIILRPLSSSTHHCPLLHTPQRGSCSMMRPRLGLPSRTRWDRQRIS